MLPPCGLQLQHSEVLVMLLKIAVLLQVAEKAGEAHDEGVWEGDAAGRALRPQRQRRD